MNMQYGNAGHDPLHLEIPSVLYHQHSTGALLIYYLLVDIADLIEQDVNCFGHEAWLDSSNDSPGYRSLYVDKVMADRRYTICRDLESYGITGAPDSWFCEVTAADTHPAQAFSA